MRYFSFNDYEDYTNKKRGGNIQKLEDKTVKYKLIETEIMSGRIKLVEILIMLVMKLKVQKMMMK